MGALTSPVLVHGRRVLSGDVARFAPRGWRRLFHAPFLAIVDIRDDSMPYVVRQKKGRVMRVPLHGSPFTGPAWSMRLFRLPGIDLARGSAVAAAAAERKGEGIHHPDYDCGWLVRDDAELVRVAYSAIDVDVNGASGAPAAPLAEVGAG